MRKMRRTQNQLIPATNIYPINVSLTDDLSNSEVLMYQTEKSEEYVAKSECLATILQRTVVENWNVVIHYHEDPKFKTGLFEMEVIAGIVRPYAANVIVDNIF